MPQNIECDTRFCAYAAEAGGTCVAISGYSETIRGGGFVYARSTKPFRRTISLYLQSCLLRCMDAGLLEWDSMLRRRAETTRITELSHVCTSQRDHVAVVCNAQRHGAPAQYDSSTMTVSDCTRPAQAASGRAGGGAGARRAQRQAWARRGRELLAEPAERGAHRRPWARPGRGRPTAQHGGAPPRHRGAKEHR